MAPGIKDQYFTMTPSFEFCKYKLNLINFLNLKQGVIVKY